MSLDPDQARTLRGLQQIVTQLDVQGDALAAYIAKCHYLCHLDYRRQISTLLA